MGLGRRRSGWCRRCLGRQAQRCPGRVVSRRCGQRVENRHPPGQFLQRGGQPPAVDQEQVGPGQDLALGRGEPKVMGIVPSRQQAGHLDRPGGQTPGQIAEHPIAGNHQDSIAGLAADIPAVLAAPASGLRLATTWHQQHPRQQRRSQHPSAMRQDRSHRGGHGGQPSRRIVGRSGPKWALVSEVAARCQHHQWACAGPGALGSDAIAMLAGDTGRRP